MGTLYYGDNLEVLREQIADESVDLIYLDPPFNSARDYNVLFAEKDDSDSEAQIQAFGDNWQWGPDAERAYRELTSGVHPHVSEKMFALIEALRSFLGTNDMMAYLVMMAIRLVELRRVLKPTGSLYLHCDPTASHYLKLVLDGIFGPERFRSEIIWKRTGSHGSSQRYAPVHDTILFYSKSEQFTWTNPRGEVDADYVAEKFKRLDSVDRAYQDIALTGAGTRKGESGQPWRGYDPTTKGRHWALPGKSLAGLKFADDSVKSKLDALDAAGLILFSKKDGLPRLKWFADQLDGTALHDIWTDISPLNSQAAERLGYPTQKPLALLERIIAASSNKGDVILDPFCGCGTAVHAAQRLGRKWIGIDVTHLAIALIRNRLDTAFPGIEYEVQGEPADLAGARQLAEADPYQFQWWALHLIGARPVGESTGRVGKKGKDRGIDGVIRFRDDPNAEKSQRLIVSVKAGHNIGPGMVRDLAGTIEGEGAPIGVLFSMFEPTAEMKAAAVKAGKWRSKTWNRDYDRLQIITVEDAFAGKRPDYPGVDVTLQAAPTDAVLTARKPKAGTLGAVDATPVAPRPADLAQPLRRAKGGPKAR